MQIFSAKLIPSQLAFYLPSAIIILRSAFAAFTGWQRLDGDRFILLSDRFEAGGEDATDGLVSTRTLLFVGYNLRSYGIEIPGLALRMFEDCSIEMDDGGGGFLAEYRPQCCDILIGYLESIVGEISL